MEKKSAENFHFFFILKNLCTLGKLAYAIYRDFFSAVKIENFVGNNLMFYLFMLKKH